MTDIEMINKLKRFFSKPKNRELLNDFIIWLDEHDVESESERYQNFIDNILTKNEVIALNFIINEIGGLEGTAVISTLVNKSKISRPVFNSLIAKLKEKQMAVVESQGVKGTYLRIDPVLINFI